MSWCETKLAATLNSRIFLFIIIIIFLVFLILIGRLKSISFRTEQDAPHKNVGKPPTHLPPLLPAQEIASLSHLTTNSMLQNTMAKYSAAFSSLKESLISFISLLVFSSLDLLDFILCFVYQFLDSMFEENPTHYCYCNHNSKEMEDVANESSLYGRKNIWRRYLLGYVNVSCSTMKKMGKVEEREMNSSTTHRWSDCGCSRCISWQKGEEGEEDRLHLVVKEPSQWSSTDACHGYEKGSVENVIFLHGFLSSSSFWVETVFPNLSESAKSRLRIFAVDLLGFGESPKPTNCMYTLEEHLERIEKSVIKSFQLNSFHLVAHSMGCVIAISLAAKLPGLVKSITLIAPPYFPTNEVNSSYKVLNRLAERKIWPPLQFGSSVMSWYEHVGRTVCFIVCRNHSKWEWLMKLVTRRRDLHFRVTDLAKHTHHSAWLTMHNVICGGAKLLDGYLDVLKREAIPFKLIQGARDQVVPLECSYNMKLKVPLAELQTVDNADHTTVILGREKEFTKELEDFWFSNKKM